MTGGADEDTTLFQSVHIHAFASSAGCSGGERVSFFRLKVPYFQVSSGYVRSEFKSRITGITDVVKTTLRLASVCYVLGAANWTGNLDR